MKVAAIILIAGFPFFSHAQKQGNIWYFGDRAGLDFNTGLPVPLTDGATYQPSEGTAAISDSTGTLLFYTNGRRIWNKNHQVMTNGDNLLGHWSSTQSALIIPQPGSSRYFYVFTTDAFQDDDLQYGFRYSLVDICLDVGLGGVDPNQKNIKLLDTVAEKLTAVRHANGIDYWIITHKYYSDAFYSYHLSSTGIIDTVVSNVGSRHPDISGGQSTGAAIGQLKASPNGNRIAIVNGNAGNYAIGEYCDFDNNIGLVSNCTDIQTNGSHQYYGVSFSPDNSKLYIGCWLNGNGIYQFNLDAGGGHPDSVKASKTLVASGTHYAMQLANNGKIYTARAGLNDYIAVIDKPNELGVNCNYTDSVVYLSGGKCSMGFPGFVDSYDYSNAMYDCEVGIDETSSLRRAIVGDAYPNPNNGSTQIPYFVPENVTGARLIFTDMLGRVLEERQLQPGYGQLNRDTHDLPSGTYLYSLIVDGKVMDNKKIIRN